MSQFGINFIHVINFSNVQNGLRISIMYVMGRVRIFVSEGWALERIMPGVLTSLSMVSCQDQQSMPPGHTLSSSLQNLKDTTSAIFIS